VSEYTSFVTSLSKGNNYDMDLPDFI